MKNHNDDLLALILGVSRTTLAPSPLGDTRRRGHDHPGHGMFFVDGNARRSPPRRALPTPASTSSSAAAGSVTELKTTTTSLGAVVTDGTGMVLNAYLKDTQGTQASACTGGCAAAWPAALIGSTPTLTGITGTVAVIPTASGGKQLALNGWPLYYFAKDKAAGDILRGSSPGAEVLPGPECG